MAWIGIYVCCGLAIICCYGLLSAGTLYPFKSHLEQIAAAARTAATATLTSVWVLWLGGTRKRNIATLLLRTGFGVWASLALYAIVGFRVSGWGTWLDLIFPSTFFAEFNWLTFIFEVAPVTALAASLFLNMSSIRVRYRSESRRDSSHDAKR